MNVKADKNCPFYLFQLMPYAFQLENIKIKKGCLILAPPPSRNTNAKLNPKELCSKLSVRKKSIFKAPCYHHYQNLMTQGRYT